MKKGLKILLMIIGIILVISIVLIAFMFIEKNQKPTLSILKGNVEINTELKLSDIVTVKNGKLKSNSELLFDTLGSQKITVKYINKKNKNFKDIIRINVVDTTSPEISLSVEEDKITAGDDYDFLKNVTVIDNSNEEIKPTIEGEYDLESAGEYELNYIAVDSSGNTSSKKFKLIVEEKKATVNYSSSYYVKVNKTLNVAMVYKLDGNNNYTNLVKTFVVSTGGDDTPNGIFTTSDRYEVLSLVGGVYGHYTLRIDGAIWFHSVPYYSGPDSNGHWTDLEYEEYNKLGTTASLGCVRLSTIDAKWIYDNLPWQTKVEIYESDTLPDGVVKPTPITIDINSENRGWDPTDPDPANPWNS